MKFDITNHAISKAHGAVHNCNWKRNKGWPVPLVPAPSHLPMWPTASWLMFLDVCLASIHQESSKSQISWALDGVWLKNIYSGPYKQDSLPILLTTNVSVSKKKVVCAVPAILLSQARNGFKYLSTLICYKFEWYESFRQSLNIAVSYTPVIVDFIIFHYFTHTK